jgi:metallo-beta-lactamase family protein
VTGSKHLVEAGGRRFLVDCGLFQGPKEWRLRNWEAPAYLGPDLDAVVLTHAHLDHSGFLPRVTALQGGRPRGPVYATPATVDLCRILLRDSAHLQEEDAAYANKEGFSRHQPALPLYTVADAEAALGLLRPRPYGEPWEVVPGVTGEYQDAGHLLGSAAARLTLPGGRVVLFSGDVGRYANPLLRDPTPPGEADVVVVESTYGDRLHSPAPPEDALAAAVNEAVGAGGSLLIPAFAVGRTQDLLYALRRLTLAGRVPALPIYVDSPLAEEATRLFLAHREAQNPLLAGQPAAMEWNAAGNVHFAETQADSKALNDRRDPLVIIAASGMATGGRILHHLKHRLPDRRTVVLLAGYQAPDTRGSQLLAGAQALKIHGQDVPVRARIRSVDGFSSHGDQAALLRWLGGLQRPPRRVFVVHGEPHPAATLAEQIRQRYGWPVTVAAYGETAPL